MIPETAAFASDMLGVPEQSLPEHPDDRVLCMTSEQTRIGLLELASRSADGSVHVSRLRNWVVSKLQGVTHLHEQEVVGDFWRVLNEGPGGTLEGIGDVISGSHGFYLQTPRLAVFGPTDDAFIVTSLPSGRLGSLGTKLRMGPVGRTLTGCERSELINHGFSVTEPRKYARMATLPSAPGDYLASLIESGSSEEWQARQGWEPYAGQAIGQGGYAFGQSARRVRVGMSMVELWRSQDPTGFTEFHLQLEEHGARSDIPIENEEWRRVAFALDALHGRQREVTLSRRDGSIVLDVGFALPPAEFRVLYAAGAAWRPGGPHARYQLGAEMSGVVREAFDRCWIKVLGMTG